MQLVYYYYQSFVIASNLFNSFKMNKCKCFRVQVHVVYLNKRQKKFIIEPQTSTNNISRDIWFMFVFVSTDLHVSRLYSRLPFTIGDKKVRRLFLMVAVNYVEVSNVSSERIFHFHFYESSWFMIVCFSSRQCAFFSNVSESNMNRNLICTTSFDSSFCRDVVSSLNK